jgi:hypothetical protein
MPHLSLETLARLLDEEPIGTESRHLEGCTACREDLDALRADRLALAELPDLLPPPPGAWDDLAARLRDEGLLGATATPAAPRRAHRFLRLAVALALFLSGAAAGFLARGSTRSAVAGGDAALATLTLAEAEAAYRAALARYAELSTDGPSTDPIARLAALENIVVTTRDALAAAPADPLINGYHMAALEQRDATVRQIALTDNDRWY